MLVHARDMASAIKNLVGVALFAAALLGLAGSAQAAIIESPLTAGSHPSGITAGPDGAIWFTEEGTNKIGRMTTNGVLTNEFPIPTPNSMPSDIVAGADGNLWFTEFNGNKIGRITTEGTITEFTVPGSSSQPYQIATGRYEINTLWFTQFGSDQIGRITTDGTITEFPLPTARGPRDIVTAVWGSALFTTADNKIGAIRESDGVITEYPIPTPNADPVGIVTNILSGYSYFTERGANKIGRFAGTAAMTEYPAGTGDPYGIAMTTPTPFPQGTESLMFTEVGPNKIGQMTISGTLTSEQPVPTVASEPTAITLGPDGRFWFTEYAADQIGRVTGTASSSTGHPRPKGASPLRVPLVPAYNPCASPNRTHGPPLANQSCSPPTLASLSVSVGTPDVNRYQAKSTAAFTALVQVGDPNTPDEDEADVRLNLSVTDVRKRFEPAADYVGEMQGAFTLRMTDRNNSDESGTLRDMPFLFDFSCLETPDPGIGSNCTASTTADSLVPGTAVEGKRTIWEVGQIRVFDGGEDGFMQTQADNTLFLRQGIFVP